MALRTVQFLAVIFTALSLIPAGAHLFELPNKINLAAEQYFVVQGIYRGWNLFAFALIPAVIINVVLAVALRRQGFASAMALLAGGCMIVTLVIFFIWVEPANRGTEYWTTIPSDWQALRTQWEYGHAVSAIATFFALCSVTVSALAARE